MAEGFGLKPSAGGAEGFAHLLKAMAAAEGDAAEISQDADGAWLVHRPSWRLGRGMDQPHPAVFEAWHGLIEGLLVSHDRFVVLNLTHRLDQGDDAILWRVRNGVEP